MLGLGPLGVKYEAPMVSNMSCTFWPMKFQCPGSVKGSVVQVCLCLAVLALFIGLLLWLTTAPVFDFGKGVGPSGGHSETNFDDTQVPLKKGEVSVLADADFYWKSSQGFENWKISKCSRSFCWERPTNFGP